MPGNLDTIAWYALGIPIYIAYLALEISVARRRSERVFSLAETLSNLTAGLGTLLVGLFIGPWVVRAWNLVHDHVAPMRWPDHGAWKLPAAMVLADFCYYLYHRAGHRFAIFWAIHGIHHQHEHLNSSVAFRLEWLADPYAALFFGLMPLLGVDSTTGFAALALVSLYTLTAHSPVLPRPTWRILVTPTIHCSHHSRDSRYAEKNYGAMLGIWDRLFGTWLEPSRGDELRADLPTVCRTHNGVRAQWGLILELGRALRREGSLRAKVRRLLSKPVLAPPEEPLRGDAEIAWFTRIYALISFVALVPIAAWLLWFRAVRPLPVQVGCSAAIIWGLYSLGGLLDGRENAVAAEQLRLAGTLIGAGALALYSPAAGAASAAIAAAGLVASLVLLPRAGRGASPETAG